jgi:hypothetical protein
MFVGQASSLPGRLEACPTLAAAAVCIFVCIAVIAAMVERTPAQTVFHTAQARERDIGEPDPAGEEITSADPTHAELGSAIETTVGIEGVYYARVRGPALEAKPVDDDAPLVLRIADAVTDADSTICELRYIGTLPGTYDLRDYLMCADGQTLEAAGPMLITVKSILPENHDGALEGIRRPAARRSWPYRAGLAAVAAVWLVPLVWLLGRRVVRRTARPELAESAAPTLADQLRPLVEAATAGRLSSAEKARLELLLIAHWRRQLDLNGCSAVEALRRLRRHPEAGELLRELEKWLHQPPGRAQVDVAAVLQPYRRAKPVEDDQLVMAEAAR